MNKKKDSSWRVWDRPLYSGHQNDGQASSFGQFNNRRQFYYYFQMIALMGGARQL
tara:strand:- start:93 stop:257 length:165 start_codon:yes stop_codon:yes gene_type:complete